MIEPAADEVVQDGGTVEDANELEARKLTEKTRHQLTNYLLAGLLVLIVVHYAATVIIEFVPTQNDRPAVHSSLDRIFETVLPVFSGLLGSAITYYFTRDNRN